MGCPSEIPLPLGLVRSSGRAQTPMTASPWAAIDLGWNGAELLLGVPCLDGGGRPMVALQCQFALGLPGDAPLGRHILSGHAHVTIVKGITEGSCHRVNQLAIPHALAPAGSREPVLAAAHHFGASTDRHLSIAHVNGLGGRNNCLQSTAT